MLHINNCTVEIFMNVRQIQLIFSRNIGFPNVWGTIGLSTFNDFPQLSTPSASQDQEGQTWGHTSRGKITIQIFDKQRIVVIFYSLPLSKVEAELTLDLFGMTAAEQYALHPYLEQTKLDYGKITA